MNTCVYFEPVPGCHFSIYQCQHLGILWIQVRLIHDMKYSLFFRLNMIHILVSIYILGLIQINLRN